MVLRIAVSAAFLGLLASPQFAQEVILALDVPLGRIDALCAVGDLDGDTIPEIACASPFSPGGPDTHVLSGRGGHTVLSLDHFGYHARNDLFCMNHGILIQRTHVVLNIHAAGNQFFHQFLAFEIQFPC